MRILGKAEYLPIVTSTHGMQYDLSAESYLLFVNHQIHQTISSVERCDPSLSRRVMLLSGDLTHIAQQLSLDVCEAHAIAACNAEAAPTSGAAKQS